MTYLNSSRLANIALLFARGGPLKILYWQAFFPSLCLPVFTMTPMYPLLPSFRRIPIMLAISPPPIRLQICLSEPSSFLARPQRLTG